MPAEFPPCFPEQDYPHNITDKSPEWYCRAFFLYNILPPKFPVKVIGWLLDKEEDAVEKTARRLQWKSRKEMRIAAKESDAKTKKPTVPAPIRKGNDIIFNGDIPRVSLIKLIKWVEYKAQEAATDEDSALMNSWLCSLAGVDGAIRARKNRQIERIKKDSVKIYLPKMDPMPKEDMEELKPIPQPIEF